MQFKLGEAGAAAAHGHSNVESQFCRFGVGRRMPRFKELKDVWGKFEVLR